VCPALSLAILHQLPYLILQICTHKLWRMLTISWNHLQTCYHRERNHWLPFAHILSYVLVQFFFWIAQKPLTYTILYLWLEKMKGLNLSSIAAKPFWHRFSIFICIKDTVHRMLNIMKTYLVDSQTTAYNPNFLLFMGVFHVNTIEYMMGHIHTSSSPG
jgi:hypothetical protein